MNRRAFLQVVGTTIAGASLPGCVGSEPTSNGSGLDAGTPTPTTTGPIYRSTPAPEREIEDRVRFRNPRWRPVGFEDMWGIQTEIENLSGDSFWVECVLLVRGQEFVGVTELNAWDEKTITILTDFPVSEPEPTTFELIPVKVDEPVTPTPVPDPENYVQITDHSLELEPALPVIRGVLKNVSDKPVRRVTVQGTFYVGDRVAEETNVSVQDLQPGEERVFLIRYFRGNEARRIDGHEVEIVRVYFQDD